MSQGMAGGIGRTSHGMSMMSNPGMMPGMQGIQMQPNMTMRSMQHAAMVGPMNQQVGSPRMLYDKEPKVVSQDNNESMKSGTPIHNASRSPEPNMSMRSMQHTAMVGPMDQQGGSLRIFNEEISGIVHDLLSPINDAGMRPAMPNNAQQNALTDLDHTKMIENFVKTTSNEDIIKMFETLPNFMN